MSTDVKRALERAERVLIGWDWNSSPESVARAAVLAFLKAMPDEFTKYQKEDPRYSTRLSLLVSWVPSTLAAAIEEAQG